jgi:ABC-type antimicrobial peptide transport system permease subunit
VIAEVSNPVLNIPRVGSTNIGRYHGLTGLNIINSSYSGAIMYFVFVAAAIAIFYIPISVLAGKRMRIASAFLSILGGICVIGPIISVATTESWTISYQFAGGGGGIQGTFSSLGIGLLVAAASAGGLAALGISDIVKLIHLRSNSAAISRNLCTGKETKNEKQHTKETVGMVSHLLTSTTPNVIS